MLSARLHFWKWALVLFLVAGSGLFASSIEVKEDALDLLPDGIVSSDLELIRQLGMINRVYISLHLESTDTIVTDRQWQKLKDSVLATGSLLQRSELLPNVVYRLPEGFERSLFTELWPLLPVIADDQDYNILREAVTDEGVRIRLKRDFQLLNSPAGIGLKERVVNDPLGLSLLIFDKLKKLRGEFEINVKDGIFASHDLKTCLIWADSSKPLTDSQHALLVQDLINKTLAESLRPGITAEVIGTLPHTLANIRTVKRDLKILLPLATGALLVFLMISFKSLRGMLVVAIPFLAALPAISIQKLVYGKVSGLALGFGIVLTGLAVDFAVHIYMALRHESASRKVILKNLQRPVMLAWATTTSVFVVLLLSSVPSHRQMAVLAIAGITLAVVISWLLVPSIAKKSPISGGLNSNVHPKQPSRFPVYLWILLLLAGALCWPWLEFNGDMRVLDATNAQLKRMDNRFHETWRGSTEQALLLAQGENLDQALNVNDQVAKFLSRENIRFQSVAPILPGSDTRISRVHKWQTFWSENRAKTAELLDHYGARLGFRKGSFAPFLNFIAERDIPFDSYALLQGPIYPLLASMVRIHDADRTATSNNVLVMTIVPESDSTWPVLQRLRNLKITGLNIISFRTWREQVEVLLHHDIVRLSLLAALVVMCMVFMFFRRLRPAAASLAPVGSALAGMSLFSFVTGQDINIMHILMGIMVIGLCVDYGIFSVCAQETGTTRTTRKAVTICAISSCIGFGVLAFAKHPALYSLGTTVLVGIGIAWPTAIWVTPALLGKRKELS